MVMQYRPIANYHYVHYLWQSVRGDSEHFSVWVISLKYFISERTVNRALIVHTTLSNSALKIIFIFAMYQNYPLALIQERAEEFFEK